MNFRMCSGYMFGHIHMLRLTMENHPFVNLVLQNNIMIYYSSFFQFTAIKEINVKIVKKMRVFCM